VKTKKTARLVALLTGALGLIAMATLADAHAKLVGVVPEADSTVASPQLIQAHFNEAVEAKLSRITLSTNDGAAVAIMNMNDAKDRSTLSIMPMRPLKPGVYIVTWSAATADGHKTEGTFKFTVK